MVLLVQCNLSEKQTTSPDYLTESELISLMEKHCIGTVRMFYNVLCCVTTVTLMYLQDASISVHIDNICNRNYVKVDTGRRLVPTKLGIVLVHGYQKVRVLMEHVCYRSNGAIIFNRLIQNWFFQQWDQLLKSNYLWLQRERYYPESHRYYSNCSHIYACVVVFQADYDQVLKHTIDIFRQKFDYFEANIEELDELFEASFSSVAESGRLFSKCGRCRHYMRYIPSRPHRLYCMNCDQTYSLPLAGTVKLYKVPY